MRIKNLVWLALILGIAVTGVMVFRPTRQAILGLNDTKPLSDEQLTTLLKQNKSIDAATLAGHKGLYYLQAGNLIGTLVDTQFSAYEDLVAEGKIGDGSTIVTDDSEILKQVQDDVSGLRDDIQALSSRPSNSSTTAIPSHDPATVADSATFDFTISGQKIGGSVIQSGLKTSLFTNDAGFIKDLATFTTSDLTEGSNKYYTDNRFNIALAAKTTDDLAQGSTNRYSQWANTPSGVTFADSVGIGSSADPMATLDVMGTFKTSGAVTLGDYNANGGLLYTDSVGGLAQLTAGIVGQCLKSSGTSPTWGACAAGDSLTGTGTTGQVAFFDSSSSVGGSDNIVWDSDDSILELSGTVDSSVGFTVNGQPLSTSYVVEGVGLYWTTARFDASLATKSTSDLAEGSELYYTDARVSANTDVAANTAGRHSAVTVADSSSLNLSLVGQQVSGSVIQSGLQTSLLNNDAGFIAGLTSFDTGDLTEGSNLYYTQARFNTAFGNKTTDNLAQGATNLYSQWTNYATGISFTDDVILGGTTTANGSFFFDASAASLSLGTNEVLDGELVLYSSGAGITDPSLTTNSSGDLVLSAPSGQIQVGNGAGNIEFVLTEEGDGLVASKTATLTQGLTSTDFFFTRNLTGGANTIGGAVVKIEDTSSTTTTNNPDMLVINAAPTSGAFTGNLLRLQSGGTDHLIVDATGLVTLSNYTANGGLLYTNASGLLTQLGVGTSGQCLVSTASIPEWGSCGDTLPADNVTGTGADKRLAIWDGATTQTSYSSLRWLSSSNRLSFGGAYQGAAWSYIDDQHVQFDIDGNSVGALVAGYSSTYSGYGILNTGYSLSPCDSRLMLGYLAESESYLSLCDDAVRLNVNTTSTDRAEIYSDQGLQFTSGDNSAFTVSGSSDLVLSGGELSVGGLGDSSFAGNVGIGTTDPGYKLEVNGGIGLAGTVTTLSEGDIFSQFDGDASLAYPVIARYWDSHDTWPSTTFIFGNGTNSVVGIEKPGNFNFGLFRVRADQSSFNGDLLANGGLTIGSGGAEITGHLSATTTWDPTNVATGSITTTTVTVTGAKLGDVVGASFSQSLPAGTTVSGAVTAVDTVTVSLTNLSGSDQDLPSGTVRATVTQY